MTVYEMAVRNVAAYIRSPENREAVQFESQSALEAFDAARVISIAFCKVYSEVLLDIANVNLTA